MTTHPIHSNPHIVNIMNLIDHMSDLGDREEVIANVADAYMRDYEAKGIALSEEVIEEIIAAHEF